MGSDVYNDGESNFADHPRERCWNRDTPKEVFKDQFRSMFDSQWTRRDGEGFSSRQRAVKWN